MEVSGSWNFSEFEDTKYTTISIDCAKKYAYEIQVGKKSVLVILVESKSHAKVSLIKDGILFLDEAVGSANRGPSKADQFHCRLQRKTRTDSDESPGRYLISFYRDETPVRRMLFDTEDNILLDE